MANLKDTEKSLLTFLAGAVVGTGITLLLTPKSGKDLQGTLEYAIESAVRKVIGRLAPKTEIDIDKNPPTHV